MKTRLQHINNIIAIMLLAVYTLVLSWGSILNYVDSSHHHIDEPVCQVEEESNLCHLAIYHEDKFEGCEHDTHFLKDTYHCELCDATIHFSYQLPTFSNQQTIYNQVKEEVSFVENKYVFRSTFLDRTRGPPQIFSIV